MANEPGNLAFNIPFVQLPLEAAALRALIERTEALIPDGCTPVWTGSNHDVPRFPTRWAENDPAKARCALMMLLTLRGCVFLYVGEDDEYRWHDEMRREAEFLRAKGTVARYTVEKGQPHRLETLAGAKAGRLFDGFEETKKGCSK